MEEIVLNVEYTKKVIIDFNRNHYKFSNRMFSRICNIFASIIVVCDMFLLVLGEYDVFKSGLIIWQILMIFCIVILNTNIFPDILTNSYLKSDKLSHGLNSKMTFNKEKLVVENEIETMRLEYSKLYKVMETKEYIYLYINKNQAIIVTKKSTLEENISKLIGILRVSVNKYIDFKK